MKNGKIPKCSETSKHCKISKKPEDLNAIRVAVGDADSLIGGELMVSASNKTLSLLKRDKTKAVCNSVEANSGEFTRDRNFSFQRIFGQD